MSNESLKTKLINAITSIFKNDAETEDEKVEAVIEEEENKDIVSEEEKEAEEVKEEIAEDVQEEGEEGTEEVADTQEVVNSAIEAERKRIQEIEEIANTIDADLVLEAKFGNNACDAKELALRAMQRDIEKNKSALEDLKADSEESKVNEVESVKSAEIVDEEHLNKNQIEDAVKSVFRKINKAKEGK